MIYRFDFHGFAGLRSLIGRRLDYISIYKGFGTEVACIFMSFNPNYGLYVTCETLDVAQRTEVGRLCFSTNLINEYNLQHVNIDVGSLVERVFQMRTHIGGDVIESGVKMVMNNGSDIIVLPHEMPYNISIMILGWNEEFRPERDLGDYQLLEEDT